LARLADGAFSDELLADLAWRTAEALLPVIAVLDPPRLVLSGPTGAAGGERLAALVEDHLRQATRWKTKVVTTGVPVHPVVSGAGIVLADHLAGRLLDRIV
jgi:predicted NBD/HSP70 family sugar kinase